MSLEQRFGRGAEILAKQIELGDERCRQRK